MLAIFLKTLPFFALIGVGYLAGRSRFFSEEATAYLTRFVFYFALSAMLFGFAANLDVAGIFSLSFVFAYLWGPRSSGCSSRPSPWRVAPAAKKPCSRRIPA
jgi:malonate transporter and related proteins